MADVGDLNRFGFRVGQVTADADYLDISIFLNGEDVSRHDRCVYLPSYLGSLQTQAVELKRCMDFERYMAIFQGRDPAQIHNLLLHGDDTIYADEAEWQRVCTFHRFLALGEPNTDPLAAFLIPAGNGSLCLTYQYEDDWESCFRRLEVVDVIPHVRLYDLIHTIESLLTLLWADT